MTSPDDTCRRIRTHLQTEYGLTIQRLVPVPSYYRRVASYRAEAAERAFMVKPFRGTETRLNQISANMLQLQNDGYSYCPDWLKTTSGKTWTKFEKQIFYVTEWIDGKRLGTDTNQFRLLGEALGRLHAMTARHNVQRRRPGITQWLHSLRQQDLQFRRDLAILRRMSNPIAQWHQRYGNKCIKLGEEAWKILKTPDVQQELAKENSHVSLIHGDITTYNIIIRDDHVFLIDWESMRYGTCFRDLVYCLANTTNFTTPRIESILHAYEHVVPLTKGQRQLLCALFRLPRESWRVCKSASKSNKAVGFQTLCTSWSRRLTAINWMDNWARE